MLQTTLIPVYTSKDTFLCLHFNMHNTLTYRERHVDCEKTERLTDTETERLTKKSGGGGVLEAIVGQHKNILVPLTRKSASRSFIFCSQVRFMLAISSWFCFNCSSISRFISRVSAGGGQTHNESATNATAYIQDWWKEVGSILKTQSGFLVHSLLVIPCCEYFSGAVPLTSSMGS